MKVPADVIAEFDESLSRHMTALHSGLRREYVVTDQPASFLDKLRGYAFNPDQERDDHGRWSGDGGGAKDWADKDFKEFERAAKDTGWKDSLTTSEADAIRSYASMGYLDVNQYLRGYTDTTKSQDEIDQLDSALSRAKFPVDAVVYRGVSDNIPFEVGTTIEDKGFTSTSLHESVAAKGAVIAEIRLPAGARAAYIAPLSGRVSEDEVLINRGARFQVVSKSDNRVVLNYVQS